MKTDRMNLAQFNLACAVAAHIRTIFDEWLRPRLKKVVGVFSLHSVNAESPPDVTTFGMVTYMFSIYVTSFLIPDCN
jgi:hypothetical protein